VPLRRRRRPLLPLASAVGILATLLLGATQLPAAGAAPAVVAAPAAVGVPAAALAAGSPGGQSFTTTPGTLEVRDGPDGTHAAKLDFDLYQPASATAATPQPAVLATNGFGLSKGAAELTSLAGFLASHGYVVLTWSAQGFGASSGCVRLDSADYDVRNAQSLIDLLQTKDFVARDATGARVGMVGGSYGGGLDATTAEVDARVRAIVPGRTWNALQYSLGPNNLVDPADPTGFDHLRTTTGVFKQEWTSLFFASGNAQTSGACAREKLATGDPAQIGGLACPGFGLEVCRTYASVTTTRQLDAEARALLARSSSGAMIDKLRIPTLLQQGQSDTLFNLNEAMATYTALQRRGVPVGFLWNDGGHGGYNSRPGEGEEYDGVVRTPGEMDSLTVPRAQLAWLDRWVRGLDVGVTGFSWFRDYAPNAATPTGASAYTSAPALPVMPDTVLTLSGSDALVAPGGTVTAGTAAFVVPPNGSPAAYSETSNFTGPASVPSVSGVPPSEVAGQNVAFTSAPFAADTESVGFPSLHLRVTHADPAADVVFFGKVYDVAPDGSRVLIRRLVAPVRVPAAQAGAPFDVKLLGFAHLFAAGHRLQVLLASTDAAYAVPGLPDVITVVTGGADPSRVSVPLRALAVTPAAGVAPATPAEAGGLGTFATAPAPRTPDRTGRPAADRTPARRTATAAPAAPAATAAPDRAQGGRALASTGPPLGLGVGAAVLLLLGLALARHHHRHQPR